jgi:hypothetical protein
MNLNHESYSKFYEFFVNVFKNRFLVNGLRKFDSEKFK